ncbi:MAG: hypothetical protein ACLGGV_04445 [Bacteroidia bacterium]
MLISDDKSLKQLKEEFQGKFPHLSINFYQKAHKTSEGNTNEQMLDENLTIATVRTIHNEGDMSIDGHLKTSTFEQQFRDKFGVNVQVFRKAKDIWLQTTVTDHWTLAEQERAALEYEQRVEG